MAANPDDTQKHYYNLDEYFALEHAGDARFEYWDGDIFCMSGGSEAHGRLASNVHYRLRRKLEGGPCLAFTADTAVKTPSLLPYRYPDASVACGEPKFENIKGVGALLNPVLLVEVLSPSTERRDNEDKFTAYKVIPTFAEYLLVAQDQHRVTHYVREGQGRWTREDVTDLTGVVILTSVGCALSLSEIYEGVTFGDLA